MAPSVSNLIGGYIRNGTCREERVRVAYGDRTLQPRTSAMIAEDCASRIEEERGFFRPEMNQIRKVLQKTKTRARLLWCGPSHFDLGRSLNKSIHSHAVHAEDYLSLGSLEVAKFRGLP